MGETRPIRRAAVAGFFYPGNAADLARDVDGMLDEASPPPIPGRVRVLVSPHAGYRYSGAVAAHGFRLLRGLDIHTVVIISPSHVEYFGFSAVFDGAGYETPLGIVPTAGDLATRVASFGARVRFDPHGHRQERLSRQEHALEVQIPFLQRVLDSFAIVPIVMGDQSWENCEALAAALAPLVDDPGILIVASTDLSHFYDSDKATRLDSVFEDTLETLDGRGLFEAVSTGKCEACGAGPVIASLIATQAAADRVCTPLRRANSGDVTGDRTSVVGYLSAAISSGL